MIPEEIIKEKVEFLRDFCIKVSPAEKVEWQKFSEFQLDRTIREKIKAKLSPL